MATVTATKNGNWSDTTVWSTGALPGVTDEVEANGYGINIDQDITVSKLKTMVALGQFIPINGIIIRADLYAGLRSCLNGQASFTVFGNGYGSPTTSSMEAIRVSGGITQVVTVTGNLVSSIGEALWMNDASQVTIYGNITGGSGTASHGANIVSTGSLTVVGNVTGGSNSNVCGIYAPGNATVNVTGNVTGGSGGGAYGINAGGALATVTVTGNVTGGPGAGTGTHGVYSSGASTAVTITGDVTGGVSSSSVGIFVRYGSCSIYGNAIGGTGAYSYGVSLTTASSAAVVNIYGKVIGNGYGNGTSGISIFSYGANNECLSCTLNIKGIQYGAKGNTPAHGPITLIDALDNTATFTKPDWTTKTLVASDTVCDFPTVANVRKDVVFDNASKTGTCAVPVASAVSLGVAVDNTVGSAVLDGASVRAAIGMSSANLDTQIGSIPTSVWAATTRTLSSFGTLIADIWSYATRTITSGGITVAEIWDSLLTSILTSGSIGKLIKDNLNATVSSRSTFDRSTESVVASNMVSEPPTVTAIRQEIDNNSTKLTSILADTNELQTDWANGGRLDLLLDTVAVPAGTNTITITINDGTDPISDVSVYIYDNTDAVFITNKTTNTSGVATFYLNDGSYKVRLKKAGVTFTSPESLTVSGNTTDIYSGETVNIGAPDDSDVCRVYEYCYEQDGSTPLMSVTATAMIKSIPYDYDNKLHSTQSTTGIYDSTTGLLYWDIVKECRVLVTITELGISSYIEVPDASTARLANLL